MPTDRLVKTRIGSAVTSRLKLPYIDELIAQKRAGEEAGELAAGHGLDYYTREYERLMAILIDASDASKLPKEPSVRSRAQLNAMLLELRAV